MQARFALLVLGPWFAAALLVAPRAHAQSEEPAPTDQGTPPEAAPAPPAAPGATAKPTPPESTAVATAEAGDSPVEQPGKTYRFVGLRYRGIIVPKFMMNMFGADGGTTVYVNDIGPEFVIRKDGFEYNFALTYASYGMSPTPFKSNSDSNDAWEIVTSDLKMIQLTADFLWSQQFSPEFSLNYGLGAGLGFVFGDLHRVQAYPPNGTDSNNPNSYIKCPGPAAAGTGGYCDNSNNHYGNYTEPSWANGGSKPNIFPWLALQTGFRFKPVRSFAARLDLGFGTSGFFFGLGADYGL
jgi:hypothetical protein